MVLSQGLVLLPPTPRPRNLPSVGDIDDVWGQCWWAQLENSWHLERDAGVLLSILCGLEDASATLQAETIWWKMPTVPRNPG